MEFWIKAAQLILSLSILIVLHEAGHFIPARIFGIRVEKFYLFFDIKFSLFKVKRGETEYGIGWLPLGGYVKISGMIDESMDTEQLEKEPEPHEFRAKPTWQRLIVMLGGVTVNLILGYLIYIMVLFGWGEDYLPTENTVYGVHITDESLIGGDLFREGDQVLKVGSKKPKTLQDASRAILIDEERSVTVLRDGQEVVVKLPKDVQRTIIKKELRSVFEPLIPFIVASTEPGMPAAKAKFKKGDSLVSVNGKEAIYYQHFVKELKDAGMATFKARFKAAKAGEIPVFEGENSFFKNVKPDPVVVGIYRKGAYDSITVTPLMSGVIGIYNKEIKDLLTIKHQDYGFFEAIPAGMSYGTNTLTSYVKSLKLLFSSEGAQQLGGFGAIGGLFPSSWDWRQFWLLTAFISIILAFMNILPIPALDGGHVMFLIYEMIAGKPPGKKFMEYAQMTGMILLLGLVLYANGNDIFKAFTR
jgi:regulator of sigma E protease